MKDTLILGTRGSKLALVQTEIIKEKLQKLHPKIKIEISIIKTTGDKNMNPVPLDSVGKDWFTKEIDKALLKGAIDIAVHSLKDLSEILPQGLIIAAIPEREDAREAFISMNGVSFEDLKKDSIIGTDSTRRKSQLLYKRPDLYIKSIRGNVNRRLEKLENGEYDGIFLAVAGLKRLGLESKITDYFSETDIVPSPGQGALAVVIKESNTDLFRVLKKLDHQPTVTAVKSERSFSKIFGGGCSMPIGAYAVCTGKTITLHGIIGSLDGKHVVKDSITGDSAAPKKIGKELAERILQKSSLWYFSKSVPQKKRYIIITRPENESRKFIKKLEKLELYGISYPTVMISKLPLTDSTKNYLRDISSFDWILFTSKNGVKFFMQAIKNLKIDVKELKILHIGAIGTKTAEMLKKYQLPVHFIPSIFTTEDLVYELQNIKGKKILLPRADIATPLLIKFLKEKGAHIINIPIYQTTLLLQPDKSLEQLYKKKEISYLTFTSPSTVKGFVKNIEELKIDTNIFSVPTISIGPVTTRTLKKYGFQNVYTADIFTEDGMLMKLKEILV